MKEVFVRKYWQEEDVTFYLHFLNNEALAQIEITSESKMFLSTDAPVQGESVLYDQSLEDLELNKDDYITKDEFMKVWNSKQ